MELAYIPSLPLSSYRILSSTGAKKIGNMGIPESDTAVALIDPQNDGMV